MTPQPVWKEKKSSESAGVAFPELGKEASIEKDLNIEIGTVKGKRGWRGILQFLSLPVAAARDKGGFGGAAQFFNISTISLTTADFCQLEILPEMLFFFLQPNGEFY